MDEATQTETDYAVDQEQVNEMDRTVLVLADLTLGALMRGNDSFKVLADAGSRLTDVLEALVESSMAPRPTNVPSIFDMVKREG